MQIITHIKGTTKIAEVVSEELIIKTSEDGLELLGNIYYQGFDKLIIYVKNISPDFFDLKNGMAGEILQKFSNYRIQLAIVGDFTSYISQSVIDFIRESNRVGNINFTGSLDEALNKLAVN